MNASAWGYLARTLEAGLLAAFVVLMLGLLLLVVRGWRLRSFRANADARLSIFSACAIASVQRRACLESGPDSTALRTAPVAGKAPRELGQLWRFESYRDADGFLDLDAMAPCDQVAFYGERVS